MSEHRPSEFSHEVQVVEQRLGVEENGINVIPEAERKGKPRDLFWPWAAANISVFGISYAAFILYFGVGFWQALVAALVGIVFSFVLVGFVSLAGKRASAPTMVISRAPFGVRGNALPTAVSYLLLVGWEIVLVALATLATSTVFERLGWASGNGVKVVAFIVIAGIVIYTGVVGFDFLMRIQTWITVVSLGLTVLYILFTLDEVNWSAISSVPSGSTQAFIGATIFAMTGFGIGWVNCGADYSRYLPRDASGRGIFGWTVFGASISPVILIVYGLLLAASDPELLAAIGSDPIGALTTILPTSALILLPFLIVVSLGFIGGAVLDIYSSGLALLTLGLKVPRAMAAGVDGVLMVLGTIYVVWIADSFFFAFQGFLYTLGVPMAAWVGIFLADMARRRTSYADDDLYDPQGRYGAVNWVAVATMVVATVVGWGLVTNFNADWLSWQGYLLDPLGLGPKGTLDAPGPWTFANIGIVAALAIGFLVTLVAGGSRIRRQEAVAV
jgi:NCS1 family nucleobase:cation symporter-1